MKKVTGEPRTTEGAKVLAFLKDFDFDPFANMSNLDSSICNIYLADGIPGQPTAIVVYFDATFDRETRDKLPNDRQHFMNSFLVPRQELHMATSFQGIMELRVRECAERLKAFHDKEYASAIPS